MRATFQPAYSANGKTSTATERVDYMAYVFAKETETMHGAQTPDFGGEDPPPRAIEVETTCPTLDASDKVDDEDELVAAIRKREELWN